MLPAQIDRFEIRDRIGGNERGTVYRAFDPDRGREVAVKRLNSSSLFTLTTQKKFAQQLERLRVLSHPALLPILGFGEDDNQPFIVTTLMSGNLTERMAGEPPPVMEVLDMFRGIGDALDYAAMNGQYHLDLKPNNILFDESGRPYVSDLGLVQVIDSLSAARQPQVNPYYTSPEQVRKRPVSAASHVYSLAAMMFHLLTGQVLFSGASDLVASFKHTSEKPRRIRKLRADVTPAFDAVMQKALEKQPGERYATCAGFIDQLYRAQGGTLRPEDVRKEISRSRMEEAERFPRKTPSVLQQPESPIRRPTVRLNQALLLSCVLGALILCAGIAAFLGLVLAQP